MRNAHSKVVLSVAGVECGKLDGLNGCLDATPCFSSHSSGGGSGGASTTATTTTNHSTSNSGEDGAATEIRVQGMGLVLC